MERARTGRPVTRHFIREQDQRRRIRLAIDWRDWDRSNGVIRDRVNAPKRRIHVSNLRSQRSELRVYRFAGRDLGLEKVEIFLDAIDRVLEIRFESGHFRSQCFDVRHDSLQQLGILGMTLFQNFIP